MADYNGRDGDHPRWDAEHNRFDDPHGRGRYDDGRFMQERNAGARPRQDRQDWRDRPADFGRENDYRNSYAAPMDGPDRDLRARPGGMDEQDRDRDYNARFGGGTFGHGFGAGERTGYYGGVSSYGRTALADDRNISSRYSPGYGDEDRNRDPRAGGDYYGPNTYGQGYRDPRDFDRSWLNRAGDEVASWIGDPDAARRRDMDRTRGHWGRGPKGYVRSDDRIREDVNDRLTEDWRLDASNVDVAVSQGEVTLSGTVDSRDDKHRAEHLIENLAGVKHVQNNLRVDESWRRKDTQDQRLSTPVGSSGSGTSLTEAQTSTGSGIGGNAGQRPGTSENGSAAH